MDPQYRVLYEAIQEIAELCQQRLNKGPDSGDQSTLNICRRALSKAAMVPKPPNPTWTGPQWSDSWASWAGRVFLDPFGHNTTPTPSYYVPNPYIAAHNTLSPSISSVETNKPRTRRDAARPCPKPSIARRLTSVTRRKLQPT